MGKKIALVQWALSAARTAGVFLGQGPSSKVKTTSASRRKSCSLKCSKPKPGPPVVSISTTRATPSAFGFPLQDAVGGCATVVGIAAGSDVTSDVGAADVTCAATVVGAATAISFTTMTGAAGTVEAGS